VDLSRPLTDRDEIGTQGWCGVKPENLLSKKNLPTPKNLTEETSNFAVLPPTRRHWEARNFDKAQHVHKENYVFHLR